MTKPVCKDCKNFIQHYALIDGKIKRVFCGHCTQRGVRKRDPYAAVCGHFAPGPEDTEAFATKEYLSKKLVEHFCSLELLPEIEDMVLKRPGGR